MLNSFENFNNISLNKDFVVKKLSENDINIKDIRYNLINWLKFEYHPKILFEELIVRIEFFNYIDKMNRLIDYERLECFLIYVLGLKEYIHFTRFDENDNKNETEEEILLLRFYDFVQHLKRIMNN